VQNEWQSRLDFLLVLIAIVVLTVLVFRLLGPQVYALTAYVLDRIAGFFAAINGLLAGVTGRAR